MYRYDGGVRGVNAKTGFVRQPFFFFYYFKLITIVIVTE